jgi:hypothetical protein
MTYVGLSYGVLEQLAAPPLPEGAAGKYLAPLQVRSLTISSLLRICQPLGLRAVLYVDEALTRKWQQQWGCRDGAKAHTRRCVPLGKAQPRRVLPSVASEMGRRGAIATNAKLTPELRSEAARRAVQARWARRAETPRQP